MTPRRWPWTVLLAWLLAPLLAAGDEGRPNVVLLFWDDRHLDDVEAPGHVGAPNLDRLMLEGRRFTAHVPTSPGRPARTLVLSGRWPHESGSYYSEGPRTHPPYKTLPLAIKRAGYELALVGGAWHEVDARPYGFLTRMPSTGARLHTVLPAFSEEHRDKPLFLWWSPEVEVTRHDVEPDPDAGPPPAWYRDDPARWALFVAQRRERARLLDEQLGELLDLLAAAGRLDDTVFVLLGDRQDKKLASEAVNEPLLTTPLVFHWKGHVEPGVVPGPLSLIDLPRTLLELTGAEAPEEVLGTSFLPAVTGPLAPLPERTLFGSLYEPRVSPASRAGKLPEKDVKVLWSRGPRWKYVLYLQDVGRSGTGNREIEVDRAAGTQELYDLEADPDEARDLARKADNEELCERLRKELVTWWTDTGGGPLAMPFFSPPLGPAPEGRPNIVLVLSDDQDWTHLGFLGNPDVRTPTIDSLASSGVVFPVAHVTMSRCRPSLASLLSGLWPHQHGIHDNQSKQLLRREGSLPNQLKQAGYATFCAGKFWEGGYESMGFLDSVGSVEFVRTDEQKSLFEFVDRYREKRPFFVWYAPLLPHGPFNPPKRLREEFADTPVAMQPGVTSSPEEFAEAERTSYAMEAWLDEGLRDFVAKLDATGELEDTLFLFLIDNGWANGSPAKGSVFERGLRTPLVVSWPKGIAGGRRVSTLVSSLDVYATILDYAGAEIPAGTQGASLRPWLEGRPGGPDREVLYGAVYDHQNTRRKVGIEHFIYAIYARTERWKFVLYLEDVQDPDEFVIWHEHAAFPARARGDRDLFDLEADPFERNDLADDPRHAALMDELLAGFLEWWRETGGAPLDLPE